MVTLQGNVNDTIQQAITDQTYIGWDKLRRGFLSNKWAMAHMASMSKNGNANTMDWSKFFTKQVLTISWAMQSYRNEALHGTNQKELRDKHLQNLCSQVDLMYKRAKELMPYNKNELKVVFKQKAERRKKHGVVALESWLKLANNVIDTAQERANNKLEQWLQRNPRIQKEAVVGGSCYEYKSLSISGSPDHICQ